MLYPTLPGEEVLWRAPRTVGFEKLPDWPEEVEIAALLPPLIKTIRAYVAIGEREALIVALWVLHAHLAHWFTASPRLIIRSDAPKSGKSTLMGLLSCLVPRPLDICGGRGGAVLDAIGFHPTFLIDRGELIKHDQDLRAILVDGSRQLGAKLLCRRKQTLRYVNLSCAAAICIEGATPELLQDRSIEITLERLKPGQKVKRDPGYYIPDDILELHLKLARWAKDHNTDITIAKMEREPGEDLNWAPLLILAGFAGPEWEAKVRAAMPEIEPQKPRSLLDQLLEDIRDVFAGRHSGGPLFSAGNGYAITDLDRIRSTDLADMLRRMEGRPWGGSEEFFTATVLARILARANIRPLMMRFHTCSETGLRSSITSKGYQLSQFAAVVASPRPSPSELLNDSNVNTQTIEDIPGVLPDDNVNMFANSNVNISYPAGGDGTDTSPAAAAPCPPSAQLDEINVNTRTSEGFPGVSSGGNVNMFANSNANTPPSPAAVFAAKAFRRLSAEFLASATHASPTVSDPLEANAASVPEI